MRVVDLPGSRASYLRLQLLDRSEEFDLELTPEETAPFSVRWNRKMRRGEVCIRDTLLAYIQTFDGGQTELHIREDYPDSLDFALFRALRAAVRFTDDLGRRDKERKGQSAGYVGRDTPVYEIRQESPFHALLGANAIEPMFGFEVYDDLTELRGRLRHGNGHVEFDIRVLPDGLEIRREGWSSLGPKADAFRALMERGAAHWKTAWDPEKFSRDVERVNAQPGVDAESVERSYDEHDALRTDQTLRTYGFTVRHRDYAWDVHHGGLLVTRVRSFNTFLLNEVALSSFCAYPETPDVRRAVARLMTEWGCQAMGKRPEDFPAFDAQDIQRRVSDIDIGYDF